MGNFKPAAGALAAAGLLAALIAAPSDATRARPAQVPCTPATNIEAIIDDSGSMAGTDANRLRVQALDLLINTLDPPTTLGAVEFGSGFDLASSADTVFAPGAVGANAAAMKSALDTKIQADGGGTDYNAGFSRSDADNPGAQARIFLTDGGHNAGNYLNGHLTHRVPTYVIGFSTAALDPTSAARLQTIANDTGGRYFPQTDSSQLQSVMNDIGAALTCQQAPTRFTDTIAQGQVASHQVRITRGTGTLVIALSWSSPLDRFAISRLRLVRNGNTIAVAAAKRKHKPHRLKVTRSTSPTFTVLHVSSLARGRLAFRVRAVRIGSGAPKVTLVTQVSHRRSAPSTSFKTPTHNIVCVHSAAATSPASIECGIRSGLKPAPARVDCHGQGDFVKNRIALQASGRVHVVTSAGDPGPFAGAGSAPVLRYGRRWRGAGITCTSRFKGLTCLNRDGHGFFLARQRWKAL
jgi:hypothetical protein